MSFDLQKTRQDFPILQKENIIYFDNGATALKPLPVIQAVGDYYTLYPANVHRGLHKISRQASEKYENARITVQKWIRASDSDEVIFTSGTTGSINLVAHSYGSLLKPGDEILISTQEHHSNIIPWQLLQNRSGTKLKILPIDNKGELNLDLLPKLLCAQTKIIALPHVSNTLGLINPLEKMIPIIRKHCDGVILIDGAQAVPHKCIDVQKLDVDFYCFSSHKIFGPTGIGILFGKKKLLERMPPFMGGGDMIDEVSFEKSTFAPLPHKFEAGTPSIAGAIGLGAAIEYLQSLDFQALEAHEENLTAYGLKKLKAISGLKILGNENSPRIPLFTFTIEGTHPQDLAMIFDQENIAVRTGHHCTWPLLKKLSIESTTRASLAFYNSTEEIDLLAHAIKKAQEILQ